MRWGHRGANSTQRPVADLLKRDDIRRIVDIALARIGQVDTIVNCAADVHFYGKAAEAWYAEDAPRSQFMVNCVAPMQLVSLVHDLCWKDNRDENAHRNRSVVNISTVSGIYAFPSQGQAFYSASKAALNMLSLHLALELAPYSIRLNALCLYQILNEAAALDVATCIVSRRGQYRANHRDLRQVDT
jgi:NAD(P)-dependent dehydrogenase (short-subunit alcohol dehydrogenase family)